LGRVTLHCLGREFRGIVVGKEKESRRKIKISGD